MEKGMATHSSNPVDRGAWQATVNEATEELEVT